MSEENNIPRSNPVIRIDISANRVHCGKTLVAGIVAKALQEAFLNEPNGRMITVKSQDGDFTQGYERAMSNQKPHLANDLHFEIIDSNERVRRGPPEGTEAVGQWKTYDMVILSPNAVDEVPDLTFSQKIEKAVRDTCVEQGVNDQTTDAIIGLILNDEKFQRLSTLTDFATSSKTE